MTAQHRHTEHMCTSRTTMGTLFSRRSVYMHAGVGLHVYLSLCPSVCASIRLCACLLRCKKKFSGMLQDSCWQLLCPLDHLLRTELDEQRLRVTNSKTTVPYSLRDSFKVSSLLLISLCNSRQCIASHYTKPANTSATHRTALRTRMPCMHAYVTAMCGCAADASTRASRYRNRDLHRRRRIC